MQQIHQLCLELFNKVTPKHAALMKYMILKRMDFEEFMITNKEFADLIVPVNDCLYTYTSGKLKEIV